MSYLLGSFALDSIGRVALAGCPDGKCSGWNYATHTAAARALERELYGPPKRKKSRKPAAKRRKVAPRTKKKAKNRTKKRRR